jgi:hypothetical protein
VASRRGGPAASRRGNASAQGSSWPAASQREYAGTRTSASSPFTPPSSHLAAVAGEIRRRLAIPIQSPSSAALPRTPRPIPRVPVQLHPLRCMSSSFPSPPPQEQSSAVRPNYVILSTSLRFVAATAPSSPYLHYSCLSSAAPRWQGSPVVHTFCLPAAAITLLHLAAWAFGPTCLLSCCLSFETTFGQSPLVILAHAGQVPTMAAAMRSERRRARAGRAPPLQTTPRVGADESRGVGGR